ncbi:carbon-nitrogen hydrolase family protein [Corynebacterium pseudodiphtheriticum]|uniref:carbon-nitrogen hydrolase family protein n=1 Tax=Corynebacterium pseudodiphtheriticum TaxID=37637 RepID=UPI00254C7AD0|nr:carbon-nitrogen hydrolase family protein [Corynebacterium pseudodiphtheriticum]MDK8478344.1 carbon-nitrogen hydrolase family protein [Corynebacterium pseudodiphtheriticum]MDK8486795.1 carbon-nitrogen hydrolase family protein [Corynebacterium pseudodiphtheriticum]MDK8494193.1 carbon-nitrogen hydrolase family protein [Corynebacterium pseudodiphtheriticum]
MKIALVQLTSGPDVQANLALAKDKIIEAADSDAQLIVLPEATFQAFDAGRLDGNANEYAELFAEEISTLADELGVTVVVGMFRPADTVEVDGKTINRVYNSALITGGGSSEFYDKIHTFDAFAYRESDTVRPGESTVVVDVAGHKVGVATCYDVRFPEQFKKMADDGAELVVLPTSWADGPGKLEQWRVLTSARALDATVYLLAAGQACPGGADKGGEKSGPTGLGHSRVLSPTGELLAEAGYDDEILYVELDDIAGEIAKARKALPVLRGTREL